jgi:hypothetical protein
LKPIRNLLNHYIKAHGVLASDFENTLAELVQMKELYPNTGLKKAFIKQSSVYKQQGISL